jgi:hypothetical protein
VLRIYQIGGPSQWDLYIIIEIMISRACKQSLALFVCACVSHRVDYVTGMCIVPNFGGGGRNVAEELTRFWFLETWSHDPSSLA